MLEKISFRIVFIYILLFTFSNQFIPSSLLNKIWHQVVPWIGKQFFNLEITTFTNGSGDTTFNYISLLTFLLIAFIGAIGWTLLDRDRKNYASLWEWLEVLIRYYLIYQMILYGLAKVFYMQFGPPSYLKLIQPYGESSPMGILWTFMGQSKGYTIFAGIGEVIGGLLLLSRKTSTLGALVVFGVMANVMAMNFFYDVPVKILSSHLVFFSLILILSDSRRLSQVFLFNRSALPRPINPHFRNYVLERIKNYAKWIIIGCGLIAAMIYMVRMQNKYGLNQSEPDHAGLYEVLQFIHNGDTLAPILAEGPRWKYLIMEGKDRGYIISMLDNRMFYKVGVDTIAQYITLDENDSRPFSVDTLFYTQLDSSIYRFQGIFKNDTLAITALRKTKEDFLLRNTKFRWINEVPFNR